MWTHENRARYDRTQLRYPGDLTEAEWALIVPLSRPPPGMRGISGRSTTTSGAGTRRWDPALGL